LNVQLQAAQAADPALQMPLFRFFVGKLRMREHDFAPDIMDDDTTTVLVLPGCAREVDAIRSWCCRSLRPSTWVEVRARRLQPLPPIGWTRSGLSRHSPRPDQVSREAGDQKPS